MAVADLAALAARPCPDWYARPQLGIFIHWGIFAVPAYAPGGVSISELFRTDYDNAMAISPYAEWYWNAMRVAGSPTAERHARLYHGQPYEAFRPDFEAAAEAFDANAWADLFKASGAGYVVFVTKHHDGYCLWPTAIDNPHRPGWHSRRDFIGELAEAVRARGMKFGLYYSGGLDWTFRHIPISNFGDMLACVPTAEDYRTYAAAQVRELIARYRPSVLWNDIAWPSDADLPGLFSDYYAAVPDGVINDRWLGMAAMFEGLRDPAARAGFNAMVKGRIAEAGGELENPAPLHCDFRTVEYSTGEHMGAKKWEACRGLGLAFGYNQDERTQDYMTGEQLASLYRDITGRGGNLLINVGPMADARIPEVQQKPLLALGRAIRGG
ncbi:MAG TPA: alpha-L-fucosidase [Hyphomonadaceae bacterium]|nr:alpha-L-fucosidase [Hyphomonadaceae bacterium]